MDLLNSSYANLVKIELRTFENLKVDTLVKMYRLF